MTERLVEAFGVHPIDLYATTEGIWGVECERHEGIHLFEYMALLENVDKEGQPVPEGEPGAKLLVTNLSNLVQPIIRLEVSDILTLESEPCRCGRTLVRRRSRAAATTFFVSRARRAARWRCIPSSSG
jgi:phenylacetate-CoA ligase